MRKHGWLIIGAFLLLGGGLFWWFGRPARYTAAKNLLDLVEEENQKTESLFRNALIVGCEKEQNRYRVRFLWNGMELEYGIESDVSPYLETFCDVTVAGGQVVGLGLKREVISAKVLTVTQDSVELEGYGVFPILDGFQMYATYGEYRLQPREEILVGYDNQCFVLEGNGICAALTVREFEAENIRVLLKTTGYTSIFHESVTVSCASNYLLCCGDSEILVNGGETVTIGRDSPYFFDGGILVYPVDKGEVQIPSIQRAIGTPSYEGTVELHLTEDGILIINEVNLENYLKRVVPSEMPASYGLETAKVQAVCARSYAYRQIQNHAYAQYGAHVDDSISFQVYNNSGEQEISTQGVIQTTGQVLSYNGEVVGTYYFSTSCGVTTDLSIWNDNPASAPFLTSRILTEQAVEATAGANPEEVTDRLQALKSEETFREFIMKEEEGALEAEYPWYRWNFTVSLEELTRRINEKLSVRVKETPAQILVLQEDGTYLPQAVDTVGDVRSLQVLERGSGGIVSKLLIEGTEHTVVACKQANVRALLGDSGQIYSNGMNNQTSGTSQLPSAFLCLEEQYDEGGTLTGYTVYGGGNGHGLGMSQNGAKELADAGLDYVRILQFFFQGTEVTKGKEL